MAEQDRWSSLRRNVNSALGTAGRSELLTGRCLVRSAISGRTAPPDRRADIDSQPVPWARVLIVAMAAAAAGIYAVRATHGDVAALAGAETAPGHLTPAHVTPAHMMPDHGAAARPEAI